MALFPIHDPARADDIRMRRRRAFLLLAGIGVAGWTLVGGQDDIRHRPIAIEPPQQHVGREPARTFRTATTAVVAVDLPCASSVTLVPRNGLGDQVTLSTRPGQESALQSIWFTDGRLGQSDACDDGGADFTLQIAPDRAFRITQTGATEVRGGSFSGVATIEVRGSGGVTLDGVGVLHDTQTGHGDVAIGSVSGRVSARLSGSGDLRIRSGTIPGLDVSSSGSGDIDMGRSVIGGARVALDGSGDFAAAAIDGGTLTAETSSTGDIAIESLHVGDAQLRGTGSGDIVIRDGTIGHLVADRTGSGDLVVNAAVFGGNVSHGGSGDVRLPHAPAVTGPPDNDE